jgi:hypothetical protein
MMGDLDSVVDAGAGQHVFDALDFAADLGAQDSLINIDDCFRRRPD